MNTLTQIIRLVSENYFEDVDMNDIMEGAIIGLLDKLDPHSSYISSEQLELITEQFDGEFEGIGIEFSILDGYITVISPIPGTPSDRAGLQSGDKIVRINNISAYKITQKDLHRISYKLRRGCVAARRQLGLQTMILAARLANHDPRCAACQP